MINFLSIAWDVDPTIFSIGPLDVNWYPIFFIIGFYPIGFLMMKSFYKREGLSTELLDPLLWALLIGTIVGSRLGHVIFYDPLYYLTHPWKILMTWEGGLASHGGSVGVLVAMWWYVRRYGKQYGFDYLWLLDRLVIPVAFTGCFIRLGNLMNSEIYGNSTDLPWGFIFELRGETVAKHPTQLYEALIYLVLGFVLLFLYRNYLPKLRRGSIFGFFMIILFGGRFLIEYVKEPQSDFEVGMFFNMGQILSIPFVLAGIILLTWSLLRGKPAPRSVVADSSGGGNKTQSQPKKEKVKTELKYSKPKK